MPLSTRRERGVVLVVILVFVLLVAATVATFLRRATVDSMISRNRESASRAEGLARGGIRLATVLLLEDELRDRAPNSTGDDLTEPWAMARYVELPFDDGATLRLQIEDSGSLLNLNAVLQFGEAGAPDENAGPLIDALLEKVIEEMPIPPGEKALYDRAELVANLLDYVDEDDLRQRGGSEDDVYQDRDPPQRPANRPLLSVEELRAVEGFDDRLVDALRPYVTVHPFVGGGGINPNTAPPHVLALIFSDDGVDLRLVDEDQVRRMLEVRQEGGVLCADEQTGERCTPMREIVPNEVYPTLAFHSRIFTVTADARVGDVNRKIEAVLDRSTGAQPLLLSWRVL